MITAQIYFRDRGDNKCLGQVLWLRAPNLGVQPNLNKPSFLTGSLLFRLLRGWVSGCKGLGLYKLVGLGFRMYTKPYTDLGCIRALGVGSEYT